MSAPMLDEHLLEARVENALWLMSRRGGGLTLGLTAKRLGVGKTTLEKALSREKDRQAQRAQLLAHG